MARVLLLGPILNRNRDDVVARCRELLAAGRGHEFLYLAATRPMLDAVTQRLLEGLPGVLAPPNVFLLSGFSRRLVNEARDSTTGAPVPAFAAIDTDQRPVQRPLMARIIARLAEQGQLPAFAPLARTDGLVDALVRLVAEIQRAGKTASEFREAIGRRADLARESQPTVDELAAGRDYDADTATVYEQFSRLLEANALTDGNSDSLRALSVARGELEGRSVTVPFLDGVRLLVLDGFFDLLPVHLELVTSLVRLIPDVVVNLNFDPANPRAFAAHADVVARFAALPGIDVRQTTETLDIADELLALRRRLFSDTVATDDGVPAAADAVGSDMSSETETAASNERIIEMTAPDRVREVRGIAKEIKRLAIDAGVAPGGVAVALRNRDAYEPLIREIFADEGIPLAVGERRSVTDLSAVRAAMKVLDAAVSNRSHAGREIGVSQLVAIAKSDYLGIDSDADVASPMTLTNSPASKDPRQPALPWDEAPDLATPLPRESADGSSNSKGAILTSDDLENAISHVGADLMLGDWISRATSLIAHDTAASSDVSTAVATLVDPETSEAEASGDETGDASEADLDSEAETHSTIAKSRNRPRLDLPVSTLRRAVGVITALGNAVLAIPYRAPVSEMAAAFRASLETLGFRLRMVESARHALTSRDALARAAVDLRAAESLDRAIDAVVESVRLVATLDGGSGEIGRAEFRADLERALAANTVALTADVPGGVRLVGLTDTRGLAFDTVFVPGLVEGEFPESARGDWIYPQSERMTYRDRLGLPLEDISPERSLENEEHAFYQAVCRATNRLYLCRPLTTEESDTIASPFLDDVRHAAGRLTSLVVPLSFDRESLLSASTSAELARGVVHAEAQGESMADDTIKALGVLSRSGDRPILGRDTERRISVEHRREHGGFDSFDGLLERRDLRRLVHDAYAERQFSATNFREYGSCAFRFFASDVLGLVPRSDAALDLQSLDTGNLVHGVLQRFFAKHATTDFASTTRDALVADLDDCANSVFDDFEERMPPLNAAVWKIERRTLGLQLERFLDAEISLQERLSDHRAVERRVEVAFGVGRRDGDASSVEAPLEMTGEGRPIRIVGRIDRIDRSADGSLVAYDYKIGRGPRLRDMEEGRDYQLGIYLAAIESLFALPGETIVGGAYLTLKDDANRIASLLADAEAPLGKALTGRKRGLDHAGFRAVRDRIADNIRNAVERIGDGDFRVAPSLSRICSYCDYPSVCRVDMYRIRRKLRADGAPSTLPLPLPRRVNGE